MKTVKSNHLSVIRSETLRPIFILIILLSSFGVASAELTAKANHDHIQIDFFYHGSTVSVSGVTDKGTDLIIKIASPDGHEKLKEKGKVAGLLWMNTGTLNIDQVPNLYSLHSTKNLQELLPQEELDRIEVGYPALQRHVSLTSSSKGEEPSRWFGEFIKYKEEAKLYATSTGNIEISEKDGKQRYYILTQWPYQAPPGDYLVNVYEIKDGKVIDTAEAKVLVDQVGIVKHLAGMAQKNAVLYGIISIVSALGAGFGVGIIFGKGGGAH